MKPPKKHKPEKKLNALRAIIRANKRKGAQYIKAPLDSIAHSGPSEHKMW